LLGGDSENACGGSKGGGHTLFGACQTRTTHDSAVKVVSITDPSHSVVAPW
jgi:hypothetical protein